MRDESIHDVQAEPPVRGVLTRPEAPKGAIALTHGAGGNCNMPLLVALGQAFAEVGYAVLRFDLPFRQRKPHGPPMGSAATDQAGIVRAANVLRARVPGPLFLGGQSYGGRQSTLAAAEHPSLADGLLLLSYPLHAPGKPLQQRTQHFPKLALPALFVQGTKDPFASPDEIAAALKLLAGKSSLLLIDGAGHDLGYTRKRAKPDVVPNIVHRFVEWFGS